MGVLFGTILGKVMIDIVVFCSLFTSKLNWHMQLQRMSITLSVMTYLQNGALLRRWLLTKLGSHAVQIEVCNYVMYFWCILFRINFWGQIFVFDILDLALAVFRVPNIFTKLVILSLCHHFKNFDAWFLTADCDSGSLKFVFWVRNFSYF